MWADAVRGEEWDHVDQTPDAVAASSVSPRSRSPHSSRSSHSYVTLARSTRTSSPSPRPLSSSPAAPSWARKEAEMGTGMTTPDGPRRGGPLARLWTAVVGFLTMRVRMWVLLLAATIVAVLIAAVSAAVKDVDQRQRDADRREAAAANYASSLRTFDLAVAARDDCLGRVGRSDANREQHQLLVDTFREMAPPSDKLDAFLARLEDGPLLGEAPFTADQCPAMPTPPVLPVELGGTP